MSLASLAHSKLPGFIHDILSAPWVSSYVRFSMSTIYQWIQNENVYRYSLIIAISSLQRTASLFVRQGKAEVIPCCHLHVSDDVRSEEGQALSWHKQAVTWLSSVIVDMITATMKSGPQLKSLLPLSRQLLDVVINTVILKAVIQREPNSGLEVIVVIITTKVKCRSWTSQLKSFLQFSRHVITCKECSTLNLIRCCD